MKKKETHSITDEYFRRKIRGSIIILIAGTLILGLLLWQLQMQEEYKRHQDMCEIALGAAASDIEANSGNAEALETAFHSGNQAVLADISRLLSKELAEKIDEPGKKGSGKIFSELMERSLVSHISLISKDGKIVMYPDRKLVGIDVVEAELLTESEAAQLLKGTKKEDGTVKPVKADSYGGSYYFYSMPFDYNGTQYVLVTGAEATSLDEQIATLRDRSAILSRENADDSVFVFAADRKSGSLIYLRADEKDLSGKSIRDAGLSEKILKDGYKGGETIDGDRYLVLSKAIDDDTVLCAAAKTAAAGSGRMSVLLWSIISFVLIMLLCMAYTAVVHDDFARRGVMTDRVPLGRKDPEGLYLDRSIFRKVFPLMIVGALAIFGISFYTHTLAELSDGMSRARSAIRNISAKYAEDVRSKGQTQKYYDELYISKANLLAFMLEEDPAALNEESDLYHFYYDDEGRREYATDEQGRRIRSVASSAALQEFCKQNELAAVYIFEEGGHTIGTNTNNWYFTISHDEKDQSYPFLEVLDGRKDSYAQEPMTDDLGNNSQYVGVPFRYYTREDGKGGTVYVTKEEYEAAENSEADGPAVTAHRSMIQVGLDEVLSAGLSEASDFTRTLSLGAIEDGYIELFDIEKDHSCIYSPDKARIGKTAAELGLPKKAFSGEDYCSFDGDSELKLFHNENGYFFETVMLRGFIYQNRLFTAAATSLVSLLLFMLMTAYICSSRREDEMLTAGVQWSPEVIRRMPGDPGEKLTKMVYILLMAFMTFVLIAAVTAENTANEESMIRFIMRGNWDRGLNIFSLSKCAFILLAAAAAINLLRIPVRLIAGIFGARSETVGQLLISVIEYGGVIAVIFYCLYLLGADSGKLLASAGLITLIIGFGAQSLIKDIIAGLFMVFESEFHVGDIVTIDGHRGIVQDIGLRTTKVMGIDDEEGNLKIFNNSEITGVLNMSKAPSWVANTISIEYGQELEYVEEVLRRGLPEIGKGEPRILTGPAYKGIDALGESGVKLIFHTTCRERDIRPVRRYVNRSILELFYRNDIRVPFPQMTMSELDKSARKTLEDLEDEESAAGNAAADNAAADGSSVRDVNTASAGSGRSKKKGREEHNESKKTTQTQDK